MLGHLEVTAIVYIWLFIEKRKFVWEKRDRSKNP